VRRQEFGIAQDRPLCLRASRMTPYENLPRSPGAASETEIQWDEAVAFLRRRLGYELPASARPHLDDLVQESLVRLLRAVRREPVDNLEALMTEIARRAAIDCLRRNTRWSAILAGDTPDLEQVADPAGAGTRLSDPVERLQFVVLEFFTVREARCQELANAYFAEQDWKVVASRSGRSHDAVRKQWSRCLEMLRQAARDEFGPLMECLGGD
jgi:RNA polymerase sigma factor (sigma-70 family)